MTDRHTADSINDDVLDALYAERDAWKERAAELVERLRDAEEGITAAVRQRKDAEDRARRATAVIARARDLATRWAVLRTHGGAASELRAALAEREYEGPGVRECTEADRRWPLEKDGE